MTTAPILIAYDGSELAQQAVRKAAELFPGRAAVVVTVWEAGLAVQAMAPAFDTTFPTAAFDPGLSMELDHASEDRAARVAGEGAELARSLGLEAEAHAVADQANIGETIAEIAAERAAAAIVTGTHGVSGLRSHLLGSTARHLLSHGDRPVLVVREPQKLSVEVLVLGVASALRPSSSTAAVYALLSSERPRPVLAAFTIGGLLFTCAFGLIVVSALHGVSLPGRESHVNAIVELAAGAAMIGFAAGAWSERVERLRRRRQGDGPGKLAERLRRPTLRLAAIAGAVTHLPGLFYLVALNSIAAGTPPFGQATAAVLIYNAIWFSVPIGAFLVAGRHAAGVRARIARINTWAVEHQQTIVAVVFGGVGAYLVVNGLADLTS